MGGVEGFVFFHFHSGSVLRNVLWHVFMFSLEGSYHHQTIVQVDAGCIAVVDVNDYVAPTGGTYQ